MSSAKEPMERGDAAQPLSIDRQASLSPGLHVVATPIGRLRDMTLRALDVIAAADVVLVEDTRVTRRLCDAYGIKPRLERYDDHTAARERPRIVERLKEGAAIALVSDAGTPLVSDPGYKLVRDVIEGEGRRTVESSWRLGPQFKISGLMPDEIGRASCRGRV